MGEDESPNGWQRLALHQELAESWRRYSSRVAAFEREHGSEQSLWNNVNASVDDVAEAGLAVVRVASSTMRSVAGSLGLMAGLFGSSDNIVDDEAADYRQASGPRAGHVDGPLATPDV